MANVAERFAIGAALGLAVSSTTLVAFSQSTSAAEALFEEGRRLMKDGDYAAACAKFQESQRLDPAGGTLMNLAGCHAKAGRTATAWAEFTDALAQAKRDKREDRITESTKRIAELTPLLSRLVVTVDSPTAAGLEVRLDGTVLGAASWGTPIPVDPGPHELTASAPSFLAWKKGISIDAKTNATLRVPALLPAPAAPSMNGAAPPSASHRPVSAFVVGGAGLAAIGVGAAFGIVAAGKKSDSNPHCNSSGCDKTGLALLRDANTAAWISDVGIGVGAASLAVATYLFFATPSPGDRHRDHAVTFVPSMSPSSIGVAAKGTF